MTKIRQKIMQVGLTALALLPATAFAKRVPPAHRVSLESARKTVLSTFSGKITGEELEYENGKWIYSFDLTSPGKTETQEVHIDAVNGKVIQSHTESPAEEAKEKQSEDSKGHEGD